ncbi:MAG: HAMP domain-containing sensor histidine kinase, partial [Gaiellales bacterium]
VAMASHELRTPLAALRAELDVVQHDAATLDDYRQAVHEAQADAIRLTSLSTSLLELAAAPGDARAIAGTQARLRELVASTTGELEVLARRHQTSLSLSVADEVVWVDRIRIEHALGNLVTNAIVHGGPGEVAIHAQVDGRPPARMLSVEVLDRGPGLGDIPSQELFVAFRRGSAVAGAGSGLGLATVASAVRAHGGTFGAENRAGGGARFWFRVPCDPSAGPADSDEWWRDKGRAIRAP